MTSHNEGGGSLSDTITKGLEHRSLTRGGEGSEKTKYRKDTEHLYHAFMYSIVILLSGIYPFYAMLSLLVTIICYPFK